MRFHKLFLPAVLLTLCASTCTLAQALPAKATLSYNPSQTPVLELGVNYTYLHANAPPAVCGCFSLNGGGGTIVVNASRGFSVVADLSAAHASNIDATTQNVTLFNYLVGPRYSYRSSRRLTPYAEALVGGSSEYSNYTFVKRAKALAASGGLGLGYGLGRHFGLTVLEADYIYSRLPNGDNNHQNYYRLSTGIVFRFGSH